MKKIFNLFVITCLFISYSVLCAQAVTTSIADVRVSHSKLNDIVGTDFLSFINRAELIGYRLENFNMTVSQYKAGVAASAKRLSEITNRLAIAENSIDYSDTEREMQIRKMYQEVDIVLADVDSKTMQLFSDLRRYMPPVTYSRFIKAYVEHYNALDITDTDIAIYTR